MAVFRSKVFSAALLVAVALACLQSGEALKCFDCNSHVDPKCADDPPEKFSVDCSTRHEGNKFILCRKIVQNIDFEVNGNKPERRVIRTCGWENNTSTRICYQRSGFGGRQEVCVCYEDNCNIAPSLSVFSGLSLAACVAALYRLVF